MGEGCQLWNELDLMLGNPAGEVGDFLFFEETSVRRVLVR